MHLPPPDQSSVPPPTMVPSSACLLKASPGCWDFHCHPAMFHNVLPGPLGIPLASTTLPAFCCSATSSGCATASLATTFDPPSHSTPLLLVLHWHATWHCTLHVFTDFGLIFYI